ncbi:MAG: hypothetical protein JXR10_07830 [Cyclobacteriaceae bacterium]
MRIICIFSFLLFSVTTYAQPAPQSALTKKIDEGVLLMDQEKYQEADELFVLAIKGMTTLPADLAYYFGKNSFYLKKYKQSINWLNKYVQLKGTRGRFYEDAIVHLRESEGAYLAENQKDAELIKETLSQETYDCGGLSKMICPVCKGEGVLFKQSPFETLYQTCRYCLGDAHLSCEEYNLFMRGMLKPKN